MGWLYKSALRPLLFRMDPEVAHEQGIGALKTISDLPPLCGLTRCLFQPPKIEPVHVFGLRFPNPVGVAAGLDKNGVAVPALAALGFGFVEVGTVTPKGQPGNPQPRLFRYPSEQALINRMGFNNQGAQAMAERLAKSYPMSRRKVPVGVNIGKAKVTSLDRALEDYLASFEMLAPQADFFVLNVSSPNTQGLRDLQAKSNLTELCQALQEASRSRAQRMDRKPWPLLLKIAPDNTESQIEDILEVLLETRFAGVIATNTTIERPGTFQKVDEAGGLSGKPVRDRSTEVIRFIHDQTEGRLPVVGVGGIFTAEDVREKLDAGASLVQVYTGFVYEGPGLAKTLVKGLAAGQSGRQSEPSSR